MTLRKTTAFVLSGGGSLGAVQVGMLQALADRDLTPDLFVGASAGALNAAFVAGRGFNHDTLAELARVWQGLRRQDVFPFTPHHHLLALAGARSSLCGAGGLRRLIETRVDYERLEEAAIPLHIVATDVLSGTEVLLSTGDLMPAVLASAAIPAVLPAVEIDGRLLFDGGVADNTPISQAVALGAERVIVLPAGVACALESPPRSALATAVHALTLLIEQRLVHDVAAYHDRVELIVLPPLCPLAVSSLDFRRAGHLMERARAGWIGSEVAASARQMGADVVLVDPAPVPLQRVLGDEIGDVFRRLHADHGVVLRLGTGIAELRGSKTVEEVVLSDGRVEEADVVVIGVGVVPRTQLAEEALGLRVDNGVVVDERLETNIAGIYAAGDIANAWHPHYQRHVRVEHWSTALNQGTTAGANAAGGREAYTRLPYFFSDQYDLGMEYVGHSEPGDTVVVQGDVDALAFVAFWNRDGEVTAAMHVNVWGVVDDLRGLVAAGRPSLGTNQ